MERGFRLWRVGWSREIGMGSGPLADGLSLALQRAVARVAPELEREERYRGLRLRDKDAAEAQDGVALLAGRDGTW